jgi:ribosomal protein S18 acetylase RimI-like enzyme
MAQGFWSPCLQAHRPPMPAGEDSQGRSTAPSVAPVTTPQVPSTSHLSCGNGADPTASPDDHGVGTIRLVLHSRLSLGLFLRLGQLRQLFDSHSFWAQNRSRVALARMLLGSCSVVSAWHDGRLVGIGRATSDGVFRAVLWDVVVAADYQGHGLGRRIVQALIASPAVASAERVYLMTTNSGGFYQRLGFTGDHGQQLLVLYLGTSRTL